MQNASPASQNSLQDGHPNVETPKENPRKAKVFSLRPQSSRAPGCVHFCFDLMVHACKTHLRLSRNRGGPFGLGSEPWPILGMGRSYLGHLGRHIWLGPCGAWHLWACWSRPLWAWFLLGRGLVGPGPIWVLALWPLSGPCGPAKENLTKSGWIS